MVFLPQIPILIEKVSLESIAGYYLLCINTHTHKPWVIKKVRKSMNSLPKNSFSHTHTALGTFKLFLSSKTLHKLGQIISASQIAALNVGVTIIAKWWERMTMKCAL